VKLVSSVEPFNHLLERPVFFRLGIQVLQADYLLMGKINLPALVDKVNAGRIGRIGIGYQGNLLVRGDGFSLPSSPWSPAASSGYPPGGRR